MSILDPTTPLILDSNVLLPAIYPRSEEHKAVAKWLDAILALGSAAPQLVFAELVDYEVRRKLLRAPAEHRNKARESLERLSALHRVFFYQRLSTPVMHQAAQFWADIRLKGQQTADEGDLDGDSILAAQAHSIGAAVVTENSRHLSRFGIRCYQWKQLSREFLAH